jgi:hypothetical protein
VTTPGRTEERRGRVQVAGGPGHDVGEQRGAELDEAAHGLETEPGTGPLRDLARDVVAAGVRVP